MSRLPFNTPPDPRATPATPPTPATGGEPGVLSVTRLAATIDAALRTGVPAAVRVVGEISGFRDRTHWYFDLKDAGAVISAVMFQSAARKASFRPENGVQVVVRGRVEFYAPGGKVSLLVDRIEPVGAGSREQELKKLVAELRALGWLDPERKRALPAFPRRVAVVTSRTGAALQDVLVTMNKRCPAVGVLIVDTRVQGDGSAQEIAAAIRLVGARHEELGIDAVLVTRGGGSAEDLWAFNERVVAQAIVECPIPIVAAIGHETDTTIAELVADERCATPTQAAMRLTPSTPELMRELDATRRRLAAAVGRIIGAERQRLASAHRHPAMRDPARALTIARERLDVRQRRLASAQRVLLGRGRSGLATMHARLDANSPAATTKRAHETVQTAGQRLQRAMTKALELSGKRADHLRRQLRSVGPMRVLERGYSVTIGRDGRVVRAPSDVRPGDVIKSMLAEGTIESVVDPGERVIAEPPISRPSLPTSTPAPKSKPSKKTTDADVPGLFG